MSQPCTAHNLEKHQKVHKYLWYSHFITYLIENNFFFEFEHSQKIEMDLNVQTMIPLFSKFVKQLFRHVRRGEAGGRGGVPQPPRFSDHAASLPLCYHIES